MKIKKGYLYRVLLVVAVAAFMHHASAQQQLGTYLQYQQHPDQLNSAYVLSSDQAKLYSIGRKQWMNVDGAPTTILLGGHFKTKNERSALGFNILHDKIGPERYTEANAFYGYDLKLSETDHISASVGLGVRWYNVRYALLEQSDQALRDDINEKIGSLNLSFMYYRPEQFYFGVTLPRLGAGEFKEVQVFRENYSFIAGYLFPIDEGMHLKANTWVAHVKDRGTIANLSATAYFNRSLGIGVNYGTTKDIGAFASFLVSNKLKVGYGYQFGVSSTSMSGMRNATHEVSLSYHFSKLLKPNLL